MKDDHIWKEIQNSMAIEGWHISDEGLELIKKEYENSGEEKIVEAVLAKVRTECSLEVYKAAWKRVAKQIRSGKFK